MKDRSLHASLREALEAATELHDWAARVDLRDLSREQLLGLMSIARALKESGTEMLEAIEHRLREQRHDD